MIATTSPFMEAASGVLSMQQFYACSGVATAVLIAALIARELLDSSEKEHHRHAISALDMVISPLSLVFAVMVTYKVIEVLKF